MVENKKETNFMIECEACKSKITGDLINHINHKREFKVNGQSIFLTYYDCPYCHKRSFVLIDDTVSLEKLKSVTDELLKLIAKKKQGERISKKQSDNFKKARQHLADYRTKLMKEYTGVQIHDDEKEIDFTLRFPIC